MEQFDPSDYSLPKTLKIASYKLTTDSDHTDRDSFEGMLTWMAPEIIKGETVCNASDVWR